MGFLDRGKRPAPGRPSPVVTVSGSSGGGRRFVGASPAEPSSLSPASRTATSGALPSPGRGSVSGGGGGANGASFNAKLKAALSYSREGGGMRRSTARDDDDDGGGGDGTSAARTRRSSTFMAGIASMLERMSDRASDITRRSSVVSVAEGSDGGRRSSVAEQSRGLFPSIVRRASHLFGSQHDMADEAAAAVAAVDQEEKRKGGGGGRGFGRLSPAPPRVSPASSPASSSPAARTATTITPITPTAAKSGGRRLPAILSRSKGAKSPPPTGGGGSSPEASFNARASLNLAGGAGTSKDGTTKDSSFGKAAGSLSLRGSMNVPVTTPAGGAVGTGGAGLRSEAERHLRMKGERDHDVFQYEIAQMIADSASTEEASAALTQAHLARLQMEEKAKKEAAEERGDVLPPAAVKRNKTLDLAAALDALTPDSPKEDDAPKPRRERRNSKDLTASAAAKRRGSHDGTGGVTGRRNSKDLTATADASSPSPPHLLRETGPSPRAGRNLVDASPESSFKDATPPPLRQRGGGATMLEGGEAAERDALRASAMNARASDSEASEAPTPLAAALAVAAPLVWDASPSAPRHRDTAIRPGAPLESVLRPPPDDANAATSGGRRARRNSKDMTAAAAAEIAMRQGRRGSKG